MDKKSIYNSLKPTKYKIAIFIILSLIFGFYVRERACAINTILLSLSCADSVGFPSVSYSVKDLGDLSDSAITNSFSAKYSMQIGNADAYLLNIIFNLAVYYAFVCLLFSVRGKG